LFAYERVQIIKVQTYESQNKHLITMLNTMTIIC